MTVNPSVRPRGRRLAVVLALLQLADAAGNEVLPEEYVTAHLDRLGVPRRIQAGLPAIKVLSSAGLLSGLRWPLVGTLTSACLVGFYGAAVAFHMRAGNHPIVAVPAAALGLSAAVLAADVYVPAIRRGSSDAQRNPGRSPLVRPPVVP